MQAVLATLTRRAATLAVACALLPGVAAPPAALAIEPGATPSTTTLGAPTLNPKPVGLTADLTATVTAGATGSVVFFDNDVQAAVVPLTGDQATWTVPADAATGTHTIKAEYDGDATYAPSEAQRTIEVGPRPVTVTLDLSGPNDASGATARRGDVVTATVDVADHGTTGALAVSGGTVDIKVGGVVKGTITLPATTIDLDTAAWAPGTNSVVAAFNPGAATDHAAGASAVFPIFIKLGSASVQYSTFYPYKDGYRDTVALRGVRFQSATVAVKIVSSTGKTVRTLSVPLGSGAWSVAWNGRNTAGTVVAAGKYKVLSTIAVGTAKQTLTTYTTVSAKRLYTYTKALKKDYAHRSAQGTYSVAWQFTLPSATVYKKLVFAVYAKSAVTGYFGPHDFTWCAKSDWDVNCMNPYGKIGTGFAWRSVTGKVTANRSGTYVRLYAMATTRTNLKYGRVTVTYGVLK